MRILVCGDRNWTDYNKIYSVLSDYPLDTEVIHGCAKGADSLGALAAKRLGFKILPFQAQWDKFGRAAGFLRNQQMLEARPDLVIAFHTDLKKSKGTKDMLMRAIRAGIKCMTFPNNSEYTNI